MQYLRLNLNRLWADVRGGAMLVLALFLTIMGLGMGSLILDTGRVVNQQSELQSFVDLAALAAAGELDGNTDAITRANSAVTQLMQDRQSYGNEDPVLAADDVTLTFLSDLPADDRTAMTAFTNVGTDARFVRVVADNFTVSSIFLNALTALSGGGGSDALVGAQAVAGWTQYQCDITPLMFCVPDGMTAATAKTWMPGRMIRLKSQNFWGPGAFGLLDVNFDPDGPCGTPNTGADFFRCAVAVEQSITQCFQKSGVDVRPGQAAGPSESGFNVRFDIYTTSLNSQKNNALFAPAPNVIKGIKANGGGSCVGNNAELSDGKWMPIEDCLANDTCRFGTTQSVNEAGTYNRPDYVSDNYTTPGLPDRTNGATSRYQMYMNEVNAVGAGNTNPILPVAFNETGRRTCSNNQSTNPDRRVLTAAAVDCNTLPPGNASDVPVLDFYRVFFTHPAGFDPLSPGYSDNVSLWVEVIEHIDPFGGGGTTGGFVRDFVQLYR